MQTHNDEPTLSLFKPTALQRWVASTARVHAAGLDQIPLQDVILAVPTLYARVVLVMYRQLVPERSICQAISPDALHRVESGSDVLVAIAGGERRDAAVSEALRLARRLGRAVVPVGMSAGPGARPVALGGSALLLPHSRVVVVIEAPFEVPPQPERIPDAWVGAIGGMLDRAAGQSRDVLATWQMHGHLPG